MLSIPRLELWVLTLLAIPATVFAAQKVKVIPEANHGTTPTLRSLAAASKVVKSVNIVDDEDESGPASIAPAHRDSVLQEKADTKLATVPGMNLPGLGLGYVGPQGPFTFSWVPSDSNASVGASQVVEVVNVSMLVFDKSTGAPTLGPVVMSTLWNGVNEYCSSQGGTALIDPIVIYDKLAGRWVLEGATLDPPYYTCFAISNTSDATGSYTAYAFSLPQNGFTTPRFGIWPDGYYLSMYNVMANYDGPAACAADRVSMLAGQAATLQCFSTPESGIGIAGMMPSDMDGATPPPTGSPNYYMIQGPAGSDSLYLYRFHVDFTSPSNSSFTGPNTISVPAYTQAALGAIVPQPVTSQKLMAIGTWVMHRVAYRNYANASPPYESLLLTHTVDVGKGGKHTGVRWYELRNLSTTPTVYQSGTYSPDTNYRWMSSIAEDQMGNIAMGYSVSGASTYPSIRYTGRQYKDKLGTMETEGTILTGSYYQTGSLRWGDFTSMAVDPVDDCTFWYTNQYMAATGTNEWGTQLFSFKFPACQ